MEGEKWVRERWWYRLAHVCQRWRNLILGSASYLGLCLVCTYGTPVADMLAHSPPLPLVIEYQYRKITAKDEEAINLALAKRDRVQRIRFNLPVLKLQKLVKAIDGEYSNLEYLFLNIEYKDRRTVLVLPETLKTPHLRHLEIYGSIPIRFQLLSTAVDLVSLNLTLYHRSTYVPPTTLHRWLSLMPQLEMLKILFDFPVTDLDVERQLMRMPIMTPVTTIMLPNLRFFASRAVSAYYEAVLSRITAPRLEIFRIYYPDPPTFSVPELLQFMGRTENFRFDRADVFFHSDRVFMSVNPHDTWTDKGAFSIDVRCCHLDRQVSSAAQISNTLSQIFTAVEDLTLSYEVHSQSTQGHDEVDRAEWLKLLRSFRNVKALLIEDALVEKLSRCLRSEDGEDLKLLPELQELTYSRLNKDDDDLDEFTSFVNARENTGRPICLIDRTTWD